jgi:hypothetical protein
MCGLRRAGTIQTADGIAVAIGNGVVARLLGEEFILVAEIATDAGRVGTSTNDRRHNVLHTPERAHALNRGGAID